MLHSNEYQSGDVLPKFGEEFYRSKYGSFFRADLKLTSNEMLLREVALAHKIADRNLTQPKFHSTAPTSACDIVSKLLARPVVPVHKGGSSIGVGVNQKSTVSTMYTPGYGTEAYVQDTALVMRAYVGCLLGLFQGTDGPGQFVSRSEAFDQQEKNWAEQTIKNEIQKRSLQ